MSRRYRVRAVNVNPAFARRGMIPQTSYHRWFWTARLQCAMATLEMGGIVADFVVEEVRS